MMKQIILSTLLLLVLTCQSYAQGIDKETAKEKALSFVLSRAASPTTASANGARRVAASTALTDITMPSDYLYGFNVGSDGGFVIVAADNSASIVGYADEGHIDSGNMPDALKDMLRHLGANVQTAVKGGEAVNLSAESSNTSTANRAIHKAAYTGTTNKVVGPLLTTTWSQFAPYNNLTPTSNGAHCATGCLATAMAQIVYYLYSTMDGQASTTFENGITGTYATSGPRTYDWSSMLPSYFSSYTDDQATAIATLMRDCGYAINATGGEISYGVGETTAYQYKTPSAYSTYFGITGATDSYATTHSTISDASALFSIIDAELNNYYPVQVSGNGHAFVCDGRAADGIYYHFNFGYAGGGDGYYCAGAYNGYDQYSDMEITSGFRLANPTSTISELKIAYNSAIKTMGLRPVGTIPGMYQLSYYNTLKGYLDEAKGVIDGTTTLSDATALVNNIETAEQDMVKYTTPFDINGYKTSDYTATGTSYRIRSLNTLGGKYGYIGWYFDNDEGTYQNEDPKTYIYTYNTGSKWRFIYDAASNGYYVGNNTLDQYITEMPGYGKDPVWHVYGDFHSVSNHNTKPDSNVNPCEIIATNYMGDGTFAITIRPMAPGYTDDHDRYLTAWEDNGASNIFATASSSSSSYYWVYGGDAYGDYYSKWLLVPVFASSVSATTPTASFAKSSVDIKKGESATQTVTTNSKGTLTYSSSDITIATVDPATGAVTGVGFGTATITAAIGGTTTYNVSGFAPAVATYTVNVRPTDPIDPTASFASSSINIENGKTATNVLTTNSDGAVTYTSSNTDYVTVDENTGAITGVQLNPSTEVTITANIAATENYNAATISYTVTVYQPLQIDSISPAEGTYLSKLGSISIHYYNYIKEIKNNPILVYDTKTGKVVDSVYGTIDPDDEACMLITFTDSLVGGTTYSIIIPENTIYGEEGEMAQGKTLTYKLKGALEPGIITARIWKTPLGDRISETPVEKMLGTYTAGDDNYPIAKHPAWDMIAYDAEKGYLTTQVDIKSESEINILSFTGLEGDTLHIVYSNSTDWGDLTKVNGGGRYSYDGYVYWDIYSKLVENNENQGYIRIMADTYLGGSMAHCWPDLGYGFVCLSLYDYDEKGYYSIYIDYYLDDRYNDPTTVSGINIKPQGETAYFTLNGQRISRPTQSGFYIISRNGCAPKKVFIR